MDEEGASAIATLADIGIAEVRLRDTLMRATNATGLFRDTQVTANKAWAENSALSAEANKRYATTQSRLTNLKNTALLFAQKVGDDLNPALQGIIDRANEMLAAFMGMDESQRMAIIKFTGFAAAIGPALLILGKTIGTVGKLSEGFGKFAIGMQYEGETYLIADGYTNTRYAYWALAYPNNLVVTDDYPNLGPDDCLVFVNKGGIAITVPYASVIAGDLLIPGSVLADAIAANAITTEKIAAGAVTANTVAANAIGTNALAAGAVTTDVLAAGAVTANTVAANAIGASAIAADAITATRSWQARSQPRRSPRRPSRPTRSLQGLSPRIRSRRTPSTPARSRQGVSRPITWRPASAASWSSEKTRPSRRSMMRWKRKPSGRSR